MIIVYNNIPYIIIDEYRWEKDHIQYKDYVVLLSDGYGLLLEQNDDGDHSYRFEYYSKYNHNYIDEYFRIQNKMKYIFIEKISYQSK